MIADAVLIVRITPIAALIAVTWSTIAYIIRQRRAHTAEMEHRAALDEINARGRRDWEALRLAYKDDDE